MQKYLHNSQGRSPLLEVKDIAIAYDNAVILQDVSFTLAQDEFISILGPSGVGKSTLLKIIAGLLPLEKGEIFVEGQKVTSGQHSRFAYMPQDDLLFPWLSVYDNVRLYDSLHPEQAVLQKREVLDLLAEFGLGGYEYALAGELSGGMRQRAAFLRTALCPADILLLDEPFAALDVISRQKMQDWLTSLRSSLQRTVILVTHDLEEAIYMSDRILLLSGRPAGIQHEYKLPQTSGSRDRHWLFEQNELKEELFRVLAV